MSHTSASAAPTTAVHSAPVHRFEIRPTHADPAGDRVRDEAMAIGIPTTGVRTARVYLLQGELSECDRERIAASLLADPVIERCDEGISVPDRDGVVEVHPLPGVMDPVAASVIEAVRALTGLDVRVSTGRRYEIDGVTREQAVIIAERLLANRVVNAIHAGAFYPDALPTGSPAEFHVTRVPIRDLDDAALERLSIDGHLFLSLDEMHAIQRQYRVLDREPTDIELETLAQTWSEHCVHKTLKSTITYRGADLDSDAVDWDHRPGHEIHPDGTVTIHNLLKSTVAAATTELMRDDPKGIGAWCLSVFVDNAGIIAIDDDYAACIKVETHNHPSALEPYGGAATGIGGCIRDIIGTGLAANPVASTDVFCVAHPDANDIPNGCIHPKRVLTEVVAGVRDYGNRMGIPTVNGAVYFDDRYIGNPLVYCGCVGVMPRQHAGAEKDSLISGDARPGDRIIALGGRTGRDGIHGATFSSAELTDTHADEFSHAVQIGNAIEEKRVLDAVLRARDFVSSGAPGTGHQAPEEGERSTGQCPAPGARCLFSAITDCGAGGFSSAVGEMGEQVGATVHLDRAPLKYDGLTYTEIWISEAQERIVLAVPPENVAALQQICDEEHVELADLGEFGSANSEVPELVLNYRGEEVGRLPMSFVHDGLPMPTRDAVWATPVRTAAVPAGHAAPRMAEAVTKLLSHPNIASKRFIIQQYDHEVQGNTIIRPQAGPLLRGPMDASVIQPVPTRPHGLAIGCGLATGLGDPARGGDSYQMALAAIDECVRNLVCVGADPARIAILDNFCWPSCKKPENLATLVRAAEGCYDAAMAYRTPFVSGKDSLNNQFKTDDGRTIEIPPTLLITGLGVMHDIDRCVTMDAKKPGNLLVLVCSGRGADDAIGGIGGSHYELLFGHPEGADDRHPRVDLTYGPAVAKQVHLLIKAGVVRSAHDVSDGGVVTAVAEMLIAGSTPSRPIGLEFDFPIDTAWGPGDAFAEFPSAYILEIAPSELERFDDIDELEAVVLGTLDNSGVLALPDDSKAPVESLAKAWLGTLDW